jgi:type VI secretion system secreted protein VgrG
MNYLTTTKFSFSSDALSPDTFGVVRFDGSEGISKCYAFEVTLVSDNLELSMPELLQNPAKLTLHRDDGDVSYHGILLSFEQLHEFNRLAFYRARLVPRLTWLSFTQHNQVFLDKSVPEIIEVCLKDGGLSGADFEMRLQGSYDPIEYVCQYSESHLDFISRWCEREGIYYFFEQTNQGEKVIFTDTQISHTPLTQGDSLTYSPPSGLESGHEREIVRSFHCRVSLTPQSVLLKDYNYRKPSLEVSGSADVDAMGRGQVYSYGDHIRTPEEGNRLAKIKAEGLLCRKEVFEGEGSVPYMMPGYTFTLKEHYRGSFNQPYLVTDVSHEGNQTGYLLAGITMGNEERGVWYRNSFSSIVSAVQFRPGQDTEKPRISGTLTAKIDAAGSGQYAELDTQGRYTVIVPFDTSGRKDGKASAPIRMAQPYAGGDHGMHFPLHKGTEVLLTFIDGDPDRPIIQAAVPNPEHPSPVNVNNQTMSAITTAGGNKIHIEDQAGSERILMHSPNQKSFIRVGAPNDPPSDYAGFNIIPGVEGIKEQTDGALDMTVGFKNTVILGLITSIVCGFRGWFTAGYLVDMCLGGKLEIQLPEIANIRNFHVNVNAQNWQTYASWSSAVRTWWHFLGTETKVRGQLVQACEQRVHTVEGDVNAQISRVAGEERRIETTASSVKTNMQTVTAQANKIETIGNHLVTVGDGLISAGAQLQTTGTTIRQCGQDAQVAGVNLSGQATLVEQTADQVQV